MESSKIACRVKALAGKRAAPFTALLICTFIMHLLMNMYASDDAVMRNTAYGPFLTFMVERYFGWSTRIFCDAAFLLLLKAPPMLWKILDSCLYTAFAFALSSLVADGKSRRVDWLIVCLFLIYPFTDMVSAGWITTTCVYLWTCAAIAFAMLPVKRLLSRPGEKLPRRYAVLGILAAFFAGSQEQACCALLALLGLFAVYRLVKRQKLHPLLIAQLVVAAIMLSLHFSSPALSIRDVEEAAVWFPDYHTLGFFTRLEMGFSGTMYHFLMEPNLLYASFAGLLTLRLAQKKAGPAILLAAAFPLCVSLCFGFGLGFEAISAAFPAFAAVRDALTHYGTAPAFGDWDTFLPLLVLLAAALCQVVALLAAFDEKKRGWLAIYILGVGVAARVALGFSPTVWASGKRTFVILNFVFVYLAALLGAEMERGRGRPLSGCLAGLSALAALQYIETLLRVNEIAQ